MQQQESFSNAAVAIAWEYLINSQRLPSMLQLQLQESNLSITRGSL